MRMTLIDWFIVLLVACIIVIGTWVIVYADDYCYLTSKDLLVHEVCFKEGDCFSPCEWDEGSVTVNGNPYGDYETVRSTATYVYSDDVLTHVGIGVPGDDIISSDTLILRLLKPPVD